MSELLIPAVLGLLLGLILHWGQLSQPWRKPSLAFLTGVTALGWTLLGVCLLAWLAVLPPDSPGVYAWLLLLCGALFALSAWACGFSPVTALAGFSLRPVEALCMLAGCLAGSLMQVDVPDLSAALAPYALWMGALCVLVGLVGTVVYLVRTAKSPLVHSPDL